MSAATVLVVDDEADIREILQLTLENAGYRVVTAADGSEALTAAEQEVPDAILLDVGMPKIDGWQVLERMKSSPAIDLATIPVVMLTAWTSDEDRVRGGIEGALRYLGKPFDPAEVVSTLDELLGDEAPAEPEERRRVQRSSLERLARLERGEKSEGGDDEGSPRVHITRLDRPAAPEPEPEDELSAKTLPAILETLSPRQRDVVDLILEGCPVTEVASTLDVSRSNVYAVLRRVAKKTGMPDGRALIHRLRRIGAQEHG